MMIATVIAFVGKAFVYLFIASLAVLVAGLAVIGMAALRLHHTPEDQLAEYRVRKGWKPVDR